MRTFGTVITFVLAAVTVAAAAYAQTPTLRLTPTYDPAGNPLSVWTTAVVVDASGDTPRPRRPLGPGGSHGWTNMTDGYASDPGGGSGGSPPRPPRHPGRPGPGMLITSPPAQRPDPLSVWTTAVVVDASGDTPRPRRPLGPGGSHGWTNMTDEPAWESGTTVTGFDDGLEPVPWSDPRPRPMGPGGSPGYTWDPPAFTPHWLDASGDSGPAPWDPPPFNPHGLNASDDGPDPRPRPMGPGGSPGYTWDPNGMQTIPHRDTGAYVILPSVGVWSR